MALKDLDLVSALGMPEAPKGTPSPAKPEKGEKPKGPGSNYLAGKPPKLKAFLMDAVDSSLSHEERAEALCRALEEQGAAPAPEAELEPLAPPPAPIGAGFEDY